MYIYMYYGGHRHFWRQVMSMHIYLCMYMYLYMYIHIYIHIYIYIHIQT